MKKIMAMICLAALLLTGCGEQTATTQENAVAVNVQEVQVGSVAEKHTVNGIVQPIHSVTVASKQPGKVAAVYKNLGDRVNAGDLLFSLDKTDYQQQVNAANSQLRQTQAAVDAAQVGLEKVDGGQTQQQINAAKAQVTQAESALINARNAYSQAEKSYSANKALFDVGAVSKTALDASEDQLESAEAAVATAQTALENARSTLELLEGTISNENRATAQASLRQAQAGQQAAQTQVNTALQSVADADVRAPIAGIISYRSCEVGQFSNTAGAFTIVDLSKIYVETDVSEKYINLIQEGSTVNISVGSIGKTVTGRVAAISPSTSGTSSYAVRIEADNSGEELKGGMTATVDFVISRKDGVIAVPANAVIKSGEKQIVYVVEEDKAQERIVTVGISDGETAEIVSGLKEGDVLVIKGQQYLKQDTPVKVTGGDSE